MAHLKNISLNIYNYFFPIESSIRDKLYTRFLWKYFPDPIDKFLMEFSKQNKSIKFIQIGANDGVSFDPIFKFVKNDHWNGILIEPLQPYFNELKRNYKKLKKQSLHFENCAISNQIGNKKIYYISNLSGLEKNYNILKAISSFNREHVINFIRDRDNLKIKSAEVRVSTLNKIIEKYNYWDFDILILDTEGYDFEIIKSIDLNLIKPKVILFEHEHFSKEDLTACTMLLKKYKYKHFVDGINTIAYAAWGN